MITKSVEYVYKEINVNETCNNKRLFPMRSQLDTRKLPCLNDAMRSCLHIFFICNILAPQDLYSTIYMLKCAVHEK